MRRWTVGVLAGLAVLVLAVPAQAKGEASEVTVTNSGGSGGIGGPAPGSGGGSGSGGGTVALLAAPIHLTGPDAAPWLGDTGIFQASQSHPATAKALGPALDVRMAYTCGDTGGVLFQQLFPYAKGGPIAHTLPNQSFCDGNLPGVWWHVAPQTMGILQGAGLPATMPAVVTEPAAGSGAASGSEAGSAGSSVNTAVAPSSNGVPVLPIALGVGAVAAVLALAAVLRRRRTVTA